MTSHPHLLDSDRSLEDRNHDVTGWDTAGKGGERSWYPPLPDKPRPRRKTTGSGQALLCALLAVLLIVGAAMMLIPSGCGGSRIPTNETAAVQNLKALATAQAQYIKKNDRYAASGWELNASGTLIAADLKNAFEAYAGNSDSPNPQPKAGYIFRMLQGDDARNLTSYWKNSNDSAAGMNTWAATARAAEPGTSGENQYYITEAGTVYKLAEPLPPDPRHKTFLLAATPAQSQTSWATAK